MRTSGISSAGRNRAALVRSTAIAWIALASLAAGCAAIEKSSARAAETCARVSICPVYALSGGNKTACIINGEQVIYPGEPDWPYDTGVCDAVRNGKVISTRDLGPEKPPAAEP